VKHLHTCQPGEDRQHESSVQWQQCSVHGASLSKAADTEHTVRLTEDMVLDRSCCCCWWCACAVPLRVVSLDSLRAAFKHAPQAIAVVKISRQGGSRAATGSDGGAAHPLPPGVTLDLGQHSMTGGPFDRNSSAYNNMEPVTPKTPGRGLKRAGMRSFSVRASPQIPGDENFSSTDGGELPWSSMEPIHSEPASPSSSGG
jgi:hypothetical protein